MKYAVCKFMVLILVTTLFFQCKKEEVTEPDNLTKRIGDYYVSNDGDDNNNGSDTLPWRTIQYAVNKMEPGKLLIVKSGNYNENVKITKGGTSEGLRINIFAEKIHKSSCEGFRVEADFVTIDGFEIQTEQPYWKGVNIKGGNHVDIRYCYIHGCPSGAIRVRDGAQYAKIVGNKIDDNGLHGISIIGNNALIENNEITNVVQFHPRGTEPGLVGQDADGLRIFGSGHIIRGNRIAKIGDPSSPYNDNPHVDAIQTWDGSSNGAPIMTNTIIEGNFISVSHSTGKGLLMEADKGNACHDIIIRNNIIEFRDIGIGAYEGTFYNIHVYNNVFKAGLNHNSWGTSVYFKEVTNFSYVNNLTVDCHPEHRKIIGGTGNVDYNLHWNSDGSTHSMEPPLQEHDIDGINPLFVQYTDAYGENDYHLQAGSPAIDKGFRLEAVKMDFDSVPRPQGSTYDIGAYEYKSE
jgi:hypothetical protein